MTSIALIGAPGAGKSKLARKIKKTNDFAIVDRYADKVSKDADLALGVYATYVGNTLVMAERMKREIGHIRRNEDYIVCGTLVETGTYASLNGATYRNINDPEEQARTRIFMNQLGIFFRDMFIYDYVFYLPLGTEDDTLSERIDSQIHEAVQQFSVPYVTLEGDLNAKRDQVFNVIDNTDPIETSAPE